MSNVARLIKHLQAQYPIATPARRVGRMSVSGRNILDENGNPWCMRGFNYGQVGLMNTNDPAADKVMGANCARLIVRACGGGTYNFPNVDGEQIGAFGNWTPAYLANIRAMAVAIKAAGPKLLLAFDSNCYQNGNQNAQAIAGCTLFDGTAWHTGQNIFTPLGQAQYLPVHLTRLAVTVRLLRGLIDLLEPLVEPNPSATGQLQSDVNAFYLRAINQALAEDPDIIPVVGGFSYQHSKAQDPFTQGTKWPVPVVGTCDLLDNIMADQASGNYASAVGDLATCRTKQNVPVICQQAGTQYSSESGGIGSSTDSTLLAAGLEALRTASGGSIGWCFWQKVSNSAGMVQYGPWYDTSPTGTVRQLASQNRVNVLQAALQAPFTAAT